MGREVGGYTFLARDREPEGVAFYGGRAGRLILFPSTDFLFRWYLPKMALLPLGNPLQIHPPTPYTLSPLFKGGEGRGEGGSNTHVPCPFGALLATLDHFLAQTFFLGGTGPQRPRPVGRRSKCPSYPSETLYRKFGITPPTPYTLFPLFKGGEGRGEGGAYTHVPCPFGALLVTLYQILAKGF